MTKDLTFGFNVTLSPMLLLFMTCIIPRILPAQASKQDSLEQLLQSENISTSDSILTMGRLGTHYYFNGKQEEGEKLLKRSEEHTSELQSRENLVCRLLLEKKKKKKKNLY